MTRTAQQDTGGGPFGGGGERDVVEANQAVITDLSKLGKAGTHFVHDFFLPGTQLTFTQAQANEIAALDGVAAVSAGLTLQAVHQEGKVPKIVAKIQTGGDRIEVNRAITPPTAAEQAKIAACMEKLGIQRRTQGPSTGLDQRGGGLGGQGGARAANPGAFAKCLPARMQRFRETITTPRETLQQVLDPPQTDIKSESYTIGGVQLGDPTTGLVTAAQVSAGRFLKGGHEALVSATYAARNSLKVGSKLDLNGTKFTVVGLVNPPLGGQGVDVYLPLAQLQKLSDQKNLVNVVLVRADDSDSVAAVEKSIQTAYAQAEVASAKDVAGTISGSLVDAANLSHSLGLALSIVAAVGAFLLAALLALSSVGKRVRELGTLKALGWTQRKVVQADCGRVPRDGRARRCRGRRTRHRCRPPRRRSSGRRSLPARQLAPASLFGVEQAARTTSDAVSLSAPVGIPILLAGFALAVIGGLLAGAAGAFRAARLRPADALRTVE